MALLQDLVGTSVDPVGIDASGVQLRPEAMHQRGIGQRRVVVPDQIVDDPVLASAMDRS